MSKRILVVEDQEDLCAILRDFLSASAQSSRPRTALRALRSGPRNDVSWNVSSPAAIKGRQSGGHIFPRRMEALDTFATVRHRTIRSKGCLSNKTALAMVFKLVEAAQRAWRRLDGCNQLPKVILGVKFA